MASSPPRPVARIDPTPSPSPSYKYYVIGYSGSSEREYLFNIAARTLGDGRRYQEIFDLNVGRLQPDGRRLEDPLVLLPGWILILPADATGPGVETGTPPLFGTSSGSPRAQTRPPAADDSSDSVSRVALFAIVVVVLGLALHLLRRGRRLLVPATVRSAVAQASDRVRLLVEQTQAPFDSGPDGPERSAREAGPERSGREAGPERSAREAGPERSAREAGPERSGREARPDPDRPADRPDYRVRDDPDHDDGSATPEPDRAAQVARPLLVDPTTARVEATVRAGQDVLTVRLIGGRPGFGGAFAWQGAPPVRRPGGAIVSLGGASTGDEAPGGLYLDLTVSPDVLSIRGDRAGVHRVARSLARQLASAGVPTVAVGDASGVGDLVGRHAATVADLVEGAREPLLVAFIGELDPADVPAVHHLVGQRQPRVIPVVSGAGPGSRWSISVSRTMPQPDGPPTPARPLRTLS